MTDRIIQEELSELQNRIHHLEIDYRGNKAEIERQRKEIVKMFTLDETIEAYKRCQSRRYDDYISPEELKRELIYVRKSKMKKHRADR